MNYCPDFQTKHLTLALMHCSVHVILVEIIVYSETTVNLIGITPQSIEIIVTYFIFSGELLFCLKSMFWKEPRCLPVDKWVNRLWYMQPM